MSGVPQARAEDHLPLVAAMVRRFPWHVREREELYQQGCLGLMKAVARYDPDHGVAFSTYASAMILGEMRMLCRLNAPIHIPRREREMRSRIRKAEDQLTAYLGRQPTVQELAASLRMEPAELAMAMEEVTVSSSDEMLALIPAQDGWMDRLFLRDIISRLPKDDQRLLLLRLRLGKTQAETARAMGLTQVQVSRRELALKQMIRRELMDEN